MQQYYVSKNVDYITATYEAPRALPLHEPDEAEYLLEASHRNYTRTFLYGSGARLLTNPDNPSVKAHAIYSASTLGVLRGEGHTDAEIIQSIIDNGGVIKRIDIAVTSRRQDGGIHELLPHTIAVWCASGWLESRLKADNHVINPELEIETAYIGSRKARNRLFRAYDKGHELDLERHRLIRYELETRKGAQNMARAVLSGKDIGGLIRRYVDFPASPVWKKIMASEPLGIEHLESEYLSRDEKRKQKNRDRWHWLCTDAAKAMARALYEDDVPIADNRNLELFGAAVRAYHARLQDEDN